MEWKIKIKKREQSTVDARRKNGTIAVFCCWFECDAVRLEPPPSSWCDVDNINGDACNVLCVVTNLGYCFLACGSTYIGFFSRSFTCSGSHVRWRRLDRDFFYFSFLWCLWCAGMGKFCERSSSRKTKINKSGKSEWTPDCDHFFVCASRGWFCERTNGVIV